MTFIKSKANFNKSVGDARLAINNTVLYTLVKYMVIKGCEGIGSREVERESEMEV